MTKTIWHFPEITPYLYIREKFRDFSPLSAPRRSDLLKLIARGAKKTMKNLYMLYYCRNFAHIN